MADRNSLGEIIVPFLSTRYGTHFYGDREPIWVEGKHKKPCQSAREASNDLPRFIKMLRRHAGVNEEALELADKLSRCDKANRCLSAACPVCSRAFQRAFVLISMAIIERLDVDWYAVSLVLSGHRFAEGKLDAERMFRPLRELVCAAMRKAGIEWALGGFDISINEHEKEKFATHWRPHVWMLVATTNKKRMKKELKASFPATKAVRRPVRVMAYDGSIAAIAYALKYTFTRRVSFRPTKRPGARNPARNTRNRFLRASQKVELAVALDKAGLASRIIQVGATTDLPAPEGLECLKGKVHLFGMSASSAGINLEGDPQALASFLVKYWQADHEEVD